MNDPFAISWLPWLLIVTPRFRNVPARTVYMVAICSIVAFRAALSDWLLHFFVVLNKNDIRFCVSLELEKL